MEKRDNAEKSNAIAKANFEAALKNPGVSDFRKESKTYKLVAQGFRLDRIEDLAAAMLSDLDTGHLNHQDVHSRLAIVGGVVAVEDLVIRRGELALKVEMRSNAGRRIVDKKKFMGR